MKAHENSSASTFVQMEFNILSSSYGIEEDNLCSLVTQAKDYAIFKGIFMKAADLSEDARITLPFCLIPSKFPQKWFNLVCELQCYLNFVLFKVSHSKEFLRECLASTVEADEFTANIFNIFETVENEDEQVSLGLIRSDYLLDCDSSGHITGIKQVENNTISASFGSISPYIRDLHKFVLKRLDQKSFESKLPVNHCLNELAKGIVTAWDTYGNYRAAVMFVVEEITLNISDQRMLEYAIMDLNEEIEVLRYTFKELRTHASLKGRTLYVKNKEVAVVYYRTGYMPEQYEPDDWKIRLLMEKSCAIKCPSAGLHLAGTKRVQLQLSRPGVLEKFVSSDIAEKLRQVFVHQYSLDLSEEGDKAVSLAIENPQKYVMKPEREGGGNNIYGEAVRDVLLHIQMSDKRKAYILMERICPPHIPNCIVQRKKSPTIQSVICELGTFGVILGSKNKIQVNNFAGHLLRSKESSMDETGIAAGFGALDSPYLE